MGYEAFVTLGSMLVIASMVGYKWGVFERAATDLMDQSFGG